MMKENTRISAYQSSVNFLTQVYVHVWGPLEPLNSSGDDTLFTSRDS